MTLADTSVWIDHFRRGNKDFSMLLEESSVLVHPFIVGELACGNLKNRARVLADIASLPHALSARDEEALALIERRHLWGKGIGWVDIHLLASALLSNCGFWTLDNTLQRTAINAGVRCFEP